MTQNEMVGCITNSMDMSLSKFREIVARGKSDVLQARGSQSDMTEQLNSNTGC